MVEVLCVLLGGRHAGWARRGRARGIEDTRKGWRTANVNHKTRCSVKKKKGSLQICVGLFELFLSLSRLVVDPITIQSWTAKMVMQLSFAINLNKIWDAVYVLSEKKS